MRLLLQNSELWSQDLGFVKVKLCNYLKAQWSKPKSSDFLSVQLLIMLVYYSYKYIIACICIYIFYSYWKNGYIFLMIRTEKSVKCISVVYKTCEYCYSWVNWLASVCRIYLWQEGMIKDSSDMHRSMLEVPDCSEQSPRNWALCRKTNEFRLIYAHLSFQKDLMKYGFFGIPFFKIYCINFAFWKRSNCLCPLVVILFKLWC